MTKIITLILEGDNKEDLRQIINHIIVDSNEFIKCLQIDNIKEQKLEVPKVFN